jgi:hypothetical protein
MAQRPAKHRPLERRLWFTLMDLTTWLPRSPAVTRVYLFAVCKATECVEWQSVDSLNEEKW